MLSCSKMVIKYMNTISTSYHYSTFVYEEFVVCFYDIDIDVIDQAGMTLTISKIVKYALLCNFISYANIVVKHNFSA